MAVHRRGEDRQLADKNTEWWRAGDREETDQKQRSRQRQPPDCAGHVFEALAVEGTMDVAGGEKEDSLGQRVAHDVKQRAENPGAAETDAQNENAHVFDTREGEETFEVAL